MTFQRFWWLGTIFLSILRYTRNFHTKIHFLENLSVYKLSLSISFGFLVCCLVFSWKFLNSILKTFSFRYIKTLRIIFMILSALLCLSMTQHISCHKTCISPRSFTILFIENVIKRQSLNCLGNAIKSGDKFFLPTYFGTPHPSL